jgi:hypothetical protein
VDSLPLRVSPLSLGDILPAGKTPPIGFDQFGSNVIIGLFQSMLAGVSGERNRFPDGSHLYSSWPEERKNILSLDHIYVNPFVYSYFSGKL